jgi:hypothetical protein
MASVISLVYMERTLVFLIQLADLVQITVLSRYRGTGRLWYSRLHDRLPLPEYFDLGADQGFSVSYPNAVKRNMLSCTATVITCTAPSWQFSIVHFVLVPFQFIF